jgi:hypothetical protein
MFLSVFGVVSLACGPRFYRLLGIAAIAAALIFTYQARQTQKEISERWGPILKPKQHP